MSQGVDRTKVILQMHEGAIRLTETGKFNHTKALEISMEMMQKICIEVIGNHVVDEDNLKDDFL